MAESRDRDADLTTLSEPTWYRDDEPGRKIRPCEQRDQAISLCRQARDGWAAAETANHELAARVEQLTRLQRAVVEAAEIGEAIPTHIVMLARGEV